MTFKKITHLIKNQIMSVKMSLLAILLLSVLELAVLCIFIGKCDYFGRTYDMLKNSGYADGDIYFSVISTNNREELINTVKALPSVSDITLDLPSYSWINSSDGKDKIPFRLVDESYIEHFPIRLRTGKGFDYSSDEIECIIMSGSEFIDGNEAVGDILTLDFYLSSDEKVTVPMKIVGYTDYDYESISFVGGGTTVSASDIFGTESPSFLVKDCDAIREAVGDYFDRSDRRVHSVMMFVEINESFDPSDISLLSSYGDVSAYGEILGKTEAEYRELLHTYLPMLIFISAFLAVNTVGLLVLAIQNMRKEEGVYYLIGARRVNILLMLTVPFVLTVVLAVIIAVTVGGVITSATTLPAVMRSLLTEVTFGNRTIVAVIVFVIAETLVVFGTVILSLKNSTPRMLIDRNAD